LDQRGLIKSKRKTAVKPEKSEKFESQRLKTGHAPKRRKLARKPGQVTAVRVTSGFEGVERMEPAEIKGHFSQKVGQGRGAGPSGKKSFKAVLTETPLTLPQRAMIAIADCR
jgi:hypothetical protein